MSVDDAKTSQYSEHEYVEGSLNNSWSNMIGFIAQGARVLDVGCSSGHLGETLIRLRGSEVVGVDVNRADVDVARTRLTDARVLNVDEAGALADLGDFDVVVFADVLEHLSHPVAALAAVRSILRPGGAVVFSIPNMTHTSIRLDLLAGRFAYTETGLLDTTHLRFYDRREVEDLFTASGFRITHTADVVSTYPFELLRDRLLSMGLTAEPAFADLLSDSDADVYQFVGRAVPNVDGQERRELRTSIPATDEILAYARYFLDENERLRDEDTKLQAIGQLEGRLAVSQAEVLDREAQLKVVQADLDRIRRHPVRSIASAAARRLRGH